MRRFALLFPLFLELGCTPDRIELFPDDAAAPIVAQDARAVIDDATATRDATNEDAAGMDASFPDALDPDTGPQDTGPLDSGFACVCRYAMCRAAGDCTTRIDARSSCTGTLCSGAAGPCRTFRDCPVETGWTCTIGADSEVTCP